MQARTRTLLGFLRRNPMVIVSIFLFLVLLIFAGVGSLLVDANDARALSAPPFRPPSAQYPFGTDKLGRNMLVVMIVGTPLTLKVGVIAACLGVGIATVLAFVAAYYGDPIDGVIRGIVDVGLTIPSILIMILIAIASGGITVDQMAFVVASTAWLWPTRTMRSQVLSLKQRLFVEVARLSGMSGLEIIFQELMPNLLPVIVANFVSTMASALLATIGLEALGLGPPDAPTLGMTIHWVILYGAVIQGLWWWWVAPIVAIVIVFFGLFLLSTGLDEVANPRLRKAV